LQNEIPTLMTEYIHSKFIYKIINWNGG